MVYYYHLASHLSNEIGFYGLQAFGLDGSEPKTNVVDAAKAYIDHIKSIQPLGPYLLAGHCFGAWIAYEIANQLVLSGEQVERLFVIDAPAPTTELAQHKNLYDRSDPAWVTKFVKAFSEGININIEHKTNDSEKRKPNC
ncbi:hypothetical protein HED51_22355 [Ochrobactrum grignonense]|nr:hypothetical protein [Brucella grignonensis]